MIIFVLPWAFMDEFIKREEQMAEVMVEEEFIIPFPNLKYIQKMSKKALILRCGRARRIILC